MQVGKIPVVRVSRGGAQGTPEDFESHFDKQHLRRKGPVAPKSRLREIENPSLQERMNSLGIEEKQ